VELVLGLAPDHVAVIERLDGARWQLRVRERVDLSVREEDAASWSETVLREIGLDDADIYRLERASVIQLAPAAPAAATARALG